MRHSKKSVFSHIKEYFFVPRSKKHKKRLRNEYLGALFVLGLGAWFTTDYLDPLKEWLSIFIDIFISEFRKGLSAWFN